MSKNQKCKLFLQNKKVSPHELDCGTDDIVNIGNTNERNYLLDEKRRDEELRSPTFLRMDCRTDEMVDIDESNERNYLQVFDDKRRDEELRSPTFLSTDYGANENVNIFEDKEKYCNHHLLDDRRRRDEELRSPTLHCFTSAENATGERKAKQSLLQKFNEENESENGGTTKHVSVQQSESTLSPKTFQSTFSTTACSSSDQDNKSKMSFKNKSFSDQSMKYSVKKSAADTTENENHMTGANQEMNTYVDEPLIYHPMPMSLAYLIKNKMNTEYAVWTYFDTFFCNGTFDLRHKKIPFIIIHIEFDPVKLTEESDGALVFKEVFVKECSIGLKSISTENFLKHQHALLLLPKNVKTILSDTDSMFNALDQIDEWFNGVDALVNELDELLVENGAILKRDGRQCHIKLVEIRNNSMQEVFIELGNMTCVGPANVVFRPVRETTSEFKKLPHGLPFLHLFLTNPKSYIC